MSELTTIARPYAKAAFDLAVEKDQLDLWSHMLIFAADVARNDTISTLLDGMQSPDKLIELFLCVCGDELNELGQNLIKVMAENGRLSVLPEVSAQFMALRHDYDKQIDVTLVSAIKLDDAQVSAITSKLEARLKRTVKLICSVDETLIAGMIIRAGDLVIDNSVNGRIRRLNDALQS